MGEVHGVFVAVDLHPFDVAVILIGVIGVATRITGPHVPLGLTIDDPFGHDLTRAAALGDAESKDTVFKGVLHARHRADQRQAVRRIGDRAVDDPADTRSLGDRHTLHRVGDDVFDPVQIILP